MDRERELNDWGREFARRAGSPEDMFHVKSVDRRLALKYMTESSIVLDVGGGRAVDAGIFARVAAEIILVEIVAGLLLAGSKLAQDSGLHEKMHFVHASALALPFRDESFDVVTCFSVLDHLGSEELVKRALGEFRRAVRKSGHVAITFPNRSYLIGTVSMMARRYADREQDSEQRFTPKQMNRMLLAEGLVPQIYDYGTAAEVGRGIQTHNVPSVLRSLPASIKNPIFSLITRSSKIILASAGFRLLGPRFGILSSPREKNSFSISSVT